MASRRQKITLLPAFVMFILSIIFSVITLTITDFSLKQSILILTMSLLLGGLISTIYWGYSWFWARKIHETNNSILFKVLSQNKILVIISLILGTTIIIWLTQLIWKDITFWNKDLGTIFFGSRTGEFISLGIGLRIIHYFFIGLTFLLIGIALLIHNSRACPFYFGYLGSIYRKNNISLKCCFKCPLEKDCRWTDNRSQIRK